MEDGSDKPKISWKLLAFFIAFFVIVVAASIEYDLHFNPSEENLEMETYCKVSTSNLANNGNYIYFITWNGSPFGDASSWAFYHMLKHFNQSAIRSNYTYSTSMQGYQFNSTPGIIFNNSEYNFTVNSQPVHFIPIYLYGNNLTNNTNEIKSGLSKLKNNPYISSKVYNDIKIYTTEVLISGGDYSSANFSNISHINTVSLITGKNGAYIFNGYIISPNAFSNNSNGYLSPENIMLNLTSPKPTYPSIKTSVSVSENSIIYHLKKVY